MERSWLEHVGDGLWARCVIMVEGVFSKETNRSKTATQYSHKGPLIPDCFVVDLACTHRVFQLATYAPMAVSEFLV